LRKGAAVLLKSNHKRTTVNKKAAAIQYYTKQIIMLTIANTPKQPDIENQLITIKTAFFKKTAQMLAFVSIDDYCFPVFSATFCNKLERKPLI
jgi:hypothetical protein